MIAIFSHFYIYFSKDLSNNGIVYIKCAYIARTLLHVLTRLIWLLLCVIVNIVIE